MNMNYIIGIVVVLVVMITISLYNRLIRRNNEVENAFGGVDVQLKKRYDLIPNLVAAVKQYAAHEKGLLTNITALRSKAIDKNLSNDEKVAIDNQISSAMKSIMVAVENYPDLKANENFMNLQRNLTEVESQISAARRTYNAVVTDYNNSIQTFPGNLMAAFLHYTRKAVFVIPEVERVNVNVSAMFN